MTRGWEPKGIYRGGRGGVAVDAGAKTFPPRILRAPRGKDFDGIDPRPAHVALGGSPTKHPQIHPLDWEKSLR